MEKCWSLCLGTTWILQLVAHNKTKKLTKELAKQWLLENWQTSGSQNVPFHWLGEVKITGMLGQQPHVQILGGASGVEVDVVGVVHPWCF